MNRTEPSGWSSAVRVVVLFTVVLATMLMGAVGAWATILPGYHQVLNRQSAECLSIARSAGFNGADAEIARCTGAGNQRWRLVDHSGGFPQPKQLQVAHSGKCLTVRDPLANDAEVVQDVCREDVDQLWTVEPYRDGYSRIRTLGQATIDGRKTESLCLDKAKGDITVYRCHDGWWQQWQSLG